MFILVQFQRLDLLSPEFDWIDLLRIDVDRFEPPRVYLRGHRLHRFDLEDLGVGPAPTLRTGVAGVGWKGIRKGTGRTTAATHKRLDRWEIA